MLLVRTGGELYALSDHCSHRGGPLHEGEIEDGTVICPLHDSVFDLRDGALDPRPRRLSRSRPGTTRAERDASKSAAGSARGPRACSNCFARRRTVDR